MGYAAQKNNTRISCQKKHEKSEKKGPAHFSARVDK
jgi:hypothetical protein